MAAITDKEAAQEYADAIGVMDGHEVSQVVAPE